MMKISQNIELMNIIGKGAYGDVFMGINLKTKEIYAIKKITKEQLESETIYQYFNNEIFILKHLNHPNIIRFKSLTEFKSDYYLSTEYCNGGSLEQAMKYYSETYNKPIDENIARYFIFNILLGIIYLNKNNLIHRDIKGDNILLNYEKEEDLITHNFLKAKIKIIDFGFARYLEQDELAGSLVGTPMYMEPSILKTFMTSKSRVVDGFYDKKVDVWSLGILTYELLIGIVPFVARNIKGLFHSVEQRDFCIPKEEKRNFKLSEAAINFIDRTLNIDMNMRPLPEELIKDPWIMGKFNSKKLYKMKTDKEIVFVEKKTSFENFWKPVEIVKPKNLSNNNTNIKKKKKLEIIGLSYVDPAKINNMNSEKTINNNNINNNLKEIVSSKKKNKKLLNYFDIKLKEKGSEISSRQIKNKELKLQIKNNRTEKIIYKDNKDDQEIGLPELSPRKINKQNSKLNNTCQITIPNFNKYDNNNNNIIYIHNTISSCRNSNTSENICYIRSGLKNNKIYSNYPKILKNLKSKKNSDSLKIFDKEKDKINHLNNCLNTNNNKMNNNNDNNDNDNNNHNINNSNNNSNNDNNNINHYSINQKKNNNLNNNFFFNSNNSSYIDTEPRIYKKKISIRKNYKKNHNEENSPNELQTEIKKSQNNDKPKTVRVKKLQLFKVPLIEQKINYSSNNNHNDLKEVNDDSN